MEEKMRSDIRDILCELVHSYDQFVEHKYIDNFLQEIMDVVAKQD